jgi:uncharacterized protein
MNENQENISPEPQNAEQAPPQEEAAATSEVSKDVRMMGMLCHLLGLVGFIGPLIIWLIKKDDDEFVDDQGKEALNWQITVLIGYVASAILVFIVIGVFLAWAISILNLIFVIIGAVKANDGVKYRYPFCIRFIK